MGEVVGCRVDGTVLGTHHTPSTFGLNSPQCRQHVWAKPTKAGAMGYLIEAVFGCYGTDFNRLKQQVIAFVAHSSVSLVIYVEHGNCWHSPLLAQSRGSRISDSSAHESQTMLWRSRDWSLFAPVSAIATANGFSQPSTDT